MHGKDEIRVRGRDFTGYRIGGAIVALLFLAALAWQAIYLFQGHNVVVPEVAWVGSGSAQPGTTIEPEASGAYASEVLTQRTLLMAERAATGPAPGEPPPPLAVGPEERLDTVPLDVRDTTIPRAWSVPSDQAAEIMRPSEKVDGWTAVPYANADLFERPEGPDMATRDRRLDDAYRRARDPRHDRAARARARHSRARAHRHRAGRANRRAFRLHRARGPLDDRRQLRRAGADRHRRRLRRDPDRAVFGEEALGDLGWVSTWGHMIFAPPFFIGIVLLFVFWVLRNLPEPSLDLPLAGALWRLHVR